MKIRPAAIFLTDGGPYFFRSLWLEQIGSLGKRSKGEDDKTPIIASLEDIFFILILFSYLCPLENQAVT